MRRRPCYAYATPMKAVSYPREKAPAGQRAPGKPVHTHGGPEIVAWLVAENGRLVCRIRDLETEVASLRGARLALERN